MVLSVEVPMQRRSWWICCLCTPCSAPPMVRLSLAVESCESCLHHDTACLRPCNLRWPLSCYATVIVGHHPAKGIRGVSTLVLDPSATVRTVIESDSHLVGDPIPGAHSRLDNACTRICPGKCKPVIKHKSDINSRAAMVPRHLM